MQLLTVFCSIILLVGRPYRFLVVFWSFLSAMYGTHTSLTKNSLCLQSHCQDKAKCIAQRYRATSQ